jgi:SAM-dependent methyltransferase
MSYYGNEIFPFQGKRGRVERRLDAHGPTVPLGTDSEHKIMSNEKDAVFNQPRSPFDFCFGEEVAAVFDDMVDRSVPFYAEIQRMISEMGRDYAVKGTNLYDLGCSTGTSMILLNRTVDQDVKFIGLDDSREMLARCEDKLKQTGIMSNSMLFNFVMTPLFLFIYQAIVRAEEDFLQNKFGQDFVDYCADVNRWLLQPGGLAATMKSMEFRWQRVVVKEYNATYVWLTGATVLTLKTAYTYQEGEYFDEFRRPLLVTLVVLLALYLFARYLKKSKTLSGD